MDVSDLKVFASVARLRNMNRAAEELHTVQSNVTARIRRLEKELGVRLFDRHSRGVQLTSAGNKLLGYTIKVMSLLEDARKAMADGDRPSGTLVIGSLETTLAMRLSPTISAFAKDCPAVDLTIRTGTTSELIELVLGYEIECAFVCGPVSHPDLKEIVCFEEELALLSARDVVNLEKILAIKDLKQIVLRSGCSYRQRLEHIFARRGIVATRVLEFATLEAILSSVAAGVGVTLMPKRLVAAMGLTNRINVHSLPKDESDVITVFVRRNDTYVSSAQMALLDHVLKSAEMTQAAQ